MCYDQAKWLVRELQLIPQVINNQEWYRGAGSRPLSHLLLLSLVLHGVAEEVCEVCGEPGVVHHLLALLDHLCNTTNVTSTNLLWGWWHKYQYHYFSILCTCTQGQATDHQGHSQHARTEHHNFQCVRWVTCKKICTKVRALRNIHCTKLLSESGVTVALLTLYSCSLSLPTALISSVPC